MDDASRAARAFYIIPYSTFNPPESSDIFVLDPLMLTNEETRLVYDAWSIGMFDHYPAIAESLESIIDKLTGQYHLNADHSVYGQSFKKGVGFESLSGSGQEMRALIDALRTDPLLFNK